jgi:hypothetical protein
MKLARLALAAVLCCVPFAAAAESLSSNSPNTLPLATPASKVVHFDIAGDDYAAPIPEGYCDLPETMSWLIALQKTMAQQAQIKLGADWIECSYRAGHAGPIKFAVIGANPAGEKLAMSRKQFLAEIAQSMSHMANAPVTTLRKEGLAPNSSRVDINDRYEYSDDSATYIVVNSSVVKDGMTINQATAAAFTLVKGRAAAVMFVILGGSPDDDAHLLTAAKVEAAQFVHANEP